MEYPYNVKRTFDLPGGGSAVVEIASSDPIDPADYMLLRPDAARAMAGSLASMANAMRPPGAREIAAEAE